MVPATEQMPQGNREADITPEENRAVTVPRSIRQDVYGAWEAIIVGFRRWIELQRLVPIPWNSTKHWFSTNELNSDGLPDEDHMPHNLSVLPESGSGDIRFEEYRKAVEDAFDLTLPESWWSSESSLQALHGCLKGLCGAYYCGTPTKEDKYNLRVGSVLLIALLAMRESSPNYSEWTRQIAPEDLEGMGEAKLLPKQPPDEAKNTARALYYLFENLFRSDPKHQTSSGDLPKIVSMGLKNDGQHLYFEFNWKADQAPDDKESFAEQVRGHAFDMPPLRGTIEAENTMASLSNLWSGLLRSSEGFGAPGTVWMEGNSLHIASTQ